MMFGPITMPYFLIILAGMFQGVGNGIVFNELQVKVQQDVEKKDVPVATSFSFLIRMIASAVAASVFGLIMNASLFKGVRESRGSITINMLNHLSDAETSKLLPQALLPQMRQILYSGIHNIMIVATILIIASFFIGYYARQKEKHSISK